MKHAFLGTLLFVSACDLGTHVDQMSAAPATAETPPDADGSQPPQAGIGMGTMNPGPTPNPTIPTVPAQGASEYYVDSTNGNDNNVGTRANVAWRSLAKVNALHLVAGDRVHLASGSLFNGTLSLKDLRGGSSYATAITVDTYGASAPATIQAPTFGNAVEVLNSEGIVLKNLRVVGDTNVTTASHTFQHRGTGFFFQNSQASGRLRFIRLLQVDASGFGLADSELGKPTDGKTGYGIEFRGENKNVGFEDVLVQDSVVHHNETTGLYSWGVRELPSNKPLSHKNFRINRVIAHHNYGVARAAKYSGNGILLSSVSQALIERSQAFANGENNPDTTAGPCGVWVYNNTCSVLQFNTVTDNHTNSGKDGCGLDADQASLYTVIRYNQSLNNEGAGILVTQVAGRPTHDYTRVESNYVEDNGADIDSGAKQIRVGSDVGHVTQSNNTNVEGGHRIQSGVDKSATGIGATAPTNSNNPFAANCSDVTVQ